MYTVGELARLTGVTVRALHHYDAIGLVRPSQRSAAGYRLYGDADVLRLQQVLLFRELGLPLDAIAGAIAEADPLELLRHHRAALLEKRGRLDAIVASVDRAIAHHEGKTTMTPTELFDGFDPHADEAREKWGDTDAYRESARRTKRYTKADWATIRAEADAIYRGIAEQRASGAAPGDPAVQELVEQHRLHIDRWFYPCSKEMQRGLGEMYVADPRFTANLDGAHGEGFASFLRDSILI